MEMPTSRGDMLAFGGSTGPELARKICACLSIIPGRAEVLQFPAGDLFVCPGGPMMYVFVPVVVTAKPLWSEYI